MRGETPSHHLLRTLASVAPGTRVVDAACGDGAHTEALARLGLDVWACDAVVDGARARLAAIVPDAAVRATPAHADALGYPDAFADWMVLTAVESHDLPGALAEAARVVVPGGWVWAEVEAADAHALAAAAEAAGLAPSEPAAADEPRGTLHAIYRRPGAVG